MKVLIVFGTRPEAIKMAPVIWALKEDSNFDVSVCSTGQHRELLDQVIDLFEIKLDNLNLMKLDQTLNQFALRAFEALGTVIRIEDPDLLLVQGDTTSAMIASLVAFYGKVKVGHIEAGLRTYNIRHPFPEEANRRIIDLVSSIHFAPTIQARENLIDERVGGKIFITGNTVVDALKWLLNKMEPVQEDKNLILVTVHRRENFGEPLYRICSALCSLAKKYKNIRIKFPVHLNPNVQKIVKECLGNIPNIELLSSLNYADFFNLMRESYLILTDSGGIQEEAPSLNKPVLILRDFTERLEVVKDGAAKLIGTNYDNIIRETSLLLDNEAVRNKMINIPNPYGNGDAAKKIKEVLKNIDFVD